MNRDSRIFLAGATGMVGSAVLRRLERDDYQRVLAPRRSELDLTDDAAVRNYFAQNRPEFVFLCAARVGGILANVSAPGEFIYQNLAIQNSVIHNAYRFGVKRLLFLGSNCIYPREAPQPIKEEHILTGPLEWTNRPYAISKIAGIEMCWSYNRQYGTSYLTLMPVNLYGPGDNFDPQTSHVIAAILRKVHEAKILGRPTVPLWGTGTPRREFMHADDVADAALFTMTLPDGVTRDLTESPIPPILNIGTGSDMTIREIAELVMEEIGYRGGIDWDTSKPDGTMRKLLDNSRITALGWSPRTPLREGIRSFYQDFLRTPHALPSATAAVR